MGQIAPESSPESSAKSLSLKFFRVPFLSLTCEWTFSEPQEHIQFCPGCLTGRSGDRGDQNNVESQNVYVPFVLSHEGASHGEKAHEEVVESDLGVDMLWNGSIITSGCVDAIKDHCESYPWKSSAGYDPACSNHWDLWASCLDLKTYLSWNTRLHHGVVNGRGGRGIVYTFAAGNSFQKGHNINNNVFGKSIFTIAVGATAQDDEHSYYSSTGASLLISAPGEAEK